MEDEIINKQYILENSKFIKDLQLCKDKEIPYPTSEGIEDLLYWCELGLITIELDLVYGESEDSYKLLLEISSFNQYLKMSDVYKMDDEFKHAISMEKNSLMLYTIPKELFFALIQILSSHHILFVLDTFEDDDQFDLALGETYGIDN